MEKSWLSAATHATVFLGPHNLYNHINKTHTQTHSKSHILTADVVIVIKRKDFEICCDMFSATDFQQRVQLAFWLIYKSREFKGRKSEIHCCTL